MTILTQPELDALALQELTGKANGAQTGHLHQRERIALIAERCCQNVEGDLCEIGCYAGATSQILAMIARKYDRKLVCVDSFKGGDYFKLDEMLPVFLKTMQPFSDVLIFHHADAHDRETHELIQSRRYAFAFSDDGHEYADHISELATLMPVTDGVIAVDDVYLNHVQNAIRDMVGEGHPDWTVLCNERLAESYVVRR